MKRKLIVFGIPLFFVVLNVFRNFLGVWMVEGKYVNTNYENSHLAEIPSRADTLILFDDMTYESSFYGKGTYTLKYELSGTSIDGSLGTSFASFGHKTINRSLLGQIRISLDSDLKQYYGKID